MAEKTRLFQDHRAVGLIMSSLTLNTRERIARDVRKLDSEFGDRERQTAVLSIHAESGRKKNHRFGSNNKRLAESRPLDLVWDIGLRADGPRARNTCQVRHVLSFTQIFATMRPGRRTRPPLVGSAPALRMQEPINFVRAVAGSLTAASARKASPSAFPTHVSGALAN